MTQRYAHLEPKHLRGAVEALDAAMRGMDTPVDTCTAEQSSGAAVDGSSPAAIATLESASAS